MSRVFVSYSSKDRKRCAEIVEFLENEGIRCWVAPRDIPPGALWMESVTEAIDDSFAVLLLVTAHSNGSSQVRRELERAVSKSKTIVPMILEEVQFSKWMQYSISVHHWHSAQKNELSRSISGIVESLKDLSPPDFAEQSSDSENHDTDFFLDLFRRKADRSLALEYRFCGDDTPEELLMRFNEKVRALAERTADRYNLSRKYTEKKTEFDFALITDREGSDARARVLLAATEIASGMETVRREAAQSGHSLRYLVRTFPGTDKESQEDDGLHLDPGSLQWLRSKDIALSGEATEIEEALKSFLNRSVSTLPECELVGRDRELNAFLDVVNRQQYWHIDNPRGFATHLAVGISGDAGLGKTALVRHLEEDILDRPEILILKGNSSQADSSTGGLWLRVLEELMGLERMKGVASDFISTFLNETFGYTIDAHDAEALSMFLNRDRMSKDSEQVKSTVSVQIAFRNLFQGLAELFDPVFILEDVHNADELSLEILRFIMSNTERNRPYVFIMTFRPVVSPESPFLEMPPGYFNCETIVLEGLERSSQKQMCDLLLSSVQSGTTCSRELLSFVEAKSGGNPLFLKELLETLIQQDAVLVGEGEWILSGEPSVVGFSENIRSLYDARLGSLEEGQRILLKCLSVLGEQFSLGTMYSFLNEIAFRTPTGNGSMLHSLDGFLKEEVSVFRRTVHFNHALLREHLYSRLDPDQLTSLHLAAARTLERDAGSDPGAIALHYREAKDNASAVAWALRKLGMLTGMHDHSGVLEWSMEVLGWISGQDEYPLQEYEFRSKRYSSFFALGEKEAAESELLKLEQLVERIDDQHRKSSVRILRASYLIQTGEMSEARALLDSIEKSALKKGAEEDVFSFYDIASRFHQLDYSPEKSMEYIEKALGLSHSAGDGIRLRKRMAALFEGRGDHGKAREILFEALKSARKIHAPVLELSVLNAIAKTHFDTGEWKEAEEFWHRGIQLARNTGNRRSEAMMLNLLGHMLSRTESIEASLQMQREALAVMEESGNQHGISKVLTDIGILYTRKGEKEKALENLERALEIARIMDNRGAVGAALANLSSLQKDLGEYEIAEKNIIEAISIWHETGYVKREAACICNRGSILEKLGRMDEAVDCFMQAVKLGESCGDREGNSIRYGNLAVMMQIQHHWEEAERNFDRAIEMCAEMGNTRMMAVWIGFKGALFDTMGNREQALENYLKSMNILKEVGDRQYLFIMMGNYAGLMAKMGNDEEAVRVEREKLKLCREKGYRVDEAASLCAIGHYYCKKEEHEIAHSYFRDACLIASEKKLAVHMFRGIMVLYRFLREKDLPVDDCFPEHWGDPDRIMRDSHMPEKQGKNI